MATITIPGMFLTGDHASRPAAGDVGSGSLYSCTDHDLIYQSDGSSWTTWATAGGGVPAGAITSSGLTMATARILGRTTASTGAVEEITVGSGLSLAAGTLTASGGAAGNLQSARYVRTSGNYTYTGSVAFANVDNTNMNFTFTTGARRVMVGFVGTVASDNTAGAVGFDVELDGARLGGTTGGLHIISQAVANELMNGSFCYVTDTLTAASHTFKLQWNNANTGHTITMRGADPFAEFYAVELYA